MEPAGGQTSATISSELDQEESEPQDNVEKEHENEHENEQEGEEEGEEEQEETVFELVDLVVVVTIALFLIAATIGFETMKDNLEESVAEDMLLILEKLFGELTVLGFLAIITFALTQTGALQMISVKIFGAKEEEELLEYFE